MSVRPRHTPPTGRSPAGAPYPAVRPSHGHPADAPRHRGRLRHRPDRAGDLGPPGTAADLAGRAGGRDRHFLLLTFQIALGLILSHPTNKSTWKLSKRIFPWHEHVWVFVMAFLVVHIVSIVLDPYRRVSIIGAFIPGLSEYRSSPVALGTMALYAFLRDRHHARATRSCCRPGCG